MPRSPLGTAITAAGAPGRDGTASKAYSPSTTFSPATPAVSGSSSAPGSVPKTRVVVCRTLPSGWIGGGGGGGLGVGGGGRGGPGPRPPPRAPAPAPAGPARDRPTRPAAA